jgi:hypothetical protein
LKFTLLVQWNVRVKSNELSPEGVHAEKGSERRALRQHGKSGAPMKSSRIRTDAGADKMAREPVHMLPKDGMWTGRRLFKVLDRFRASELENMRAGFN